MFEAFYGSFWQHPLLLWLFPVLFLFRVKPRRGFFGRSLLLFSVMTLVDPLMTGPLTSYFGWTGGVAQAVMIFFVIFGDLRFYFFVEQFSGSRRELPAPGRFGRTLRAAALSFVVPLLQLLLIESFSESFENVRYTFLAYELLFFLVALLYLYVLLPGRKMKDETRRWLSEVTKFCLLYYGLWATADVIILSGFDLGYLLRVVPNVLYYGLFVPFVYWRSPQDFKASLNATEPRREEVVS